MRLIPRTTLSRNLLAASGGTVVFFAASFVRNLALARLIGPIDFGSWTLGLVLLQYGQWSQLSILNGFRLDGARARGAGDWSRLVRLRQLSLSACLLPALIVSVVAAAVAAVTGAGPLRNAILLLAAVLVPYQLYNLANSSLSTLERFTASARLQVAYAMVNLALTLALAWRWGFWGALSAQTLSYVVVLIVFGREVGIRLRPLIDLRLARELIQVGLPIAVNGVVYTLFTTVDRTLTASFLGIAALGQYGLTSLARSSIGLIPGAVSEVIYMRTANLFGESGESRGLVPIVINTDRLLAYPVALAIGLAVIWAPPTITLALPSYRQGTLPLQIFLVGLFFTFPVYAGVLLTVIGRARELAAIYALATAVEIVLVLLAVHPFGIEGVAAATAAASALMFVCINIWGLRRVGTKWSDTTLHMLDCLLPMLVVVASLAIGGLVTGWLPQAGWIPRWELASSAVVLLLWVVLLLARSYFSRLHGPR